MYKYLTEKAKDKKPVNPHREKLEYKQAQGLAEDVRFYGEWMREKAWQKIGQLYPQIDLPVECGSGKATVIAWLWAHTVLSSDPAFAGTHVPLTSSSVLSSKKGKEAWIELIVNNQEKPFNIR